MTLDIDELRELAEDLYVNGYNRYASAMSKAADEIECLRAKIAEMERQAPVGTAVDMSGTIGFTKAYFIADKVPLGSKLYALPGAQPAPSVPSVPDGWKLVPVEPPPEMIRALVDGANQYAAWNEGYRDMLAAAPEAKP